MPLASRIGTLSCLKMVASSHVQFCIVRHIIGGDLDFNGLSILGSNLSMLEVVFQDIIKLQSSEMQKVKVQDIGVKVWDPGVKVRDVGVKVRDVGVKVWDIGVEVQDIGVKVQM
ncbi:hypothetical protein PAXRUDRAFT_28980 [Paxillus rubicundulus Ve08.2h10]|uniref:Uncharacterized protein n=1 Tax=Paxillus rubicundulus Ve08.2h10 TaxID=930991 RepID=A0A0D0D7L4_9AGAM|nr:hypothetical protein PAXRUDRAFT_28980 [Paxillus rubicundulus Ve08.2h10]